MRSSPRPTRPSPRRCASTLSWRIAAFTCPLGVAVVAIDAVLLAVHARATLSERIHHVCVRIVAVADMPSRFGSFRIVAFWNNRDRKDHVAIVRGDVVGAPGGDWLGPLLRPLLAMLIDPFVGQELVMLMAQQSAEDLEALASLAESGQLRATIDRRYGLEEIADAIRYSETGRARGKIIIEVND